MPRRSSRAKAEPDANAETRVTRRSLRGAQPESPAKAAPAKESPAKPAARGRGARSTSRRGRSEAEEEVKEEPTVEPTAESEASEEPEEEVPASPKKAKKSPAPARGRARGRGRSRGRSPRAAAAKADDEDAAEEDAAAEAAIKDTVSPSRRSRRPSAQRTPETTPTRSRRGRSSVAEAAAEPEAPMEEEAAADDKEDKKRKREDEEEASKPEDEEKAVKKQKVEEAPVEEKPAAASKEEADTKETEEEMETEAAEEVKEDAEMAESKEPTVEAAKEEAKKEETPEKKESQNEEEPKKAADEDEPMVEEEATKEEAKTETIEDEAKTETKEDEAKTETKEDEPKTETMEAEAEPETREEEAKMKEDESVTKKPEVVTKEPEVVTQEPEAKQHEPATKEETAEAEAAPVEEEKAAETMAEQETETPCADSSEPKPTEEKMEAAAYAAPDKADASDPKDIIKDYVVVNMDDVPASDSAEVSQCVPAEKPASTEESTPNQREENATTDQTPEKMSTEVASNGSSTHLSNSTPADSQHHNDTAISNGSDTESSADPLFSRKFIANPNLAADVDQSKKFTLASYNILADCHVQQEKYPWMDKGSLLMESRSKRFIQELKYLDADIICLQEVSPDYYNNTLLPTLKASGYEGVFKKRIDEHNNEGEATFFRSSQFSLVSHRGLALRDIAFKELTELEACGLDADKAAAVKASVDRPAVVLITQLKSNSLGTLLTVGNLHVSYEPITNLDLQCIQAACAVKEVVSMSESPNNAHVICGDFNARPETVLYQLTKEGYLNDTSMSALQAMQNVTMKDDTKQALVNLWWKGFQHTSSSLRSCYSTVTGSEPMTARGHTGVCKNIDYIWCGGSNLDVSGVAAASPENLITAGIPNATFPSDHLSLKAELFFK